jgi:signal peptidase I
MTMPRARIWFVLTLVVLILVPGAGCSSGSSITAESTCGAYLGSETQERHAAAARISSELHAYSAGNSMWGSSLDAECATEPDTTLRAYFAGQLALNVPSVAMERTLNVGDMVLVNTLAYSRAAPRRGEVVLFAAPESWRTGATTERFIKRVIAAGGDHVVCCDAQHRLVLNGHPLDEPYLYTDASGRADPPSSDAFDIEVPAGRLWVLGDHRSRSGDSREHFLRFGDIVQATVPVDAVVGRAYVVFDSREHDEPRWLSVPPTYADIPDPPR